MMIKLVLVPFLVTGCAAAISAADLTTGPAAGGGDRGYRSDVSTVNGSVAVLDGRTLWYPANSQKVRLASIDACELAQWSFDSRRPHPQADKAAPRPVPCGPLSRAWLKRLIGNASVECQAVSHDADGVLNARCVAQGRDLGLEMLRVGWARTAGPAPMPYTQIQRVAMISRYGMWSTYVLDMPEWRAKAVDQTLARRPIADLNLLTERKSEISPPFADARRLPKRNDR